jgi:BlaI family transcriptional regulator, penicillinase repressor
MKEPHHHQLSRRERQIMDLIYKMGKATAADIHEGIPDQPTYSTVRAKLRVLEEKGYIRHEEQGPRYVFIPVTPRDKARTSALQHVIDTFFGGSAEQVVATLLDSSTSKISDDQLDRLSRLIDKARNEGL